MSEKEAQKQLRRMLTSFTPGSILHLLAEAMRAHAEQTQADNDPRIKEQCDLAEACLVVVGMGIDAVCPQGPAS